MISDYSFGSDFNADAGPWVVPTKGEPWPLVYNQISRHGFLLLQPSVFAIEVSK